MIERKLQAAADSLPDPRSDFLAVEEKIQLKKQNKQRSWHTSRRRYALVMLMAVLLVGCVAISEPDYHLYNGNWWSFIGGVDEIRDMTGQAWKDTQKAAEKLGITLPETLDGYPVIYYGRWNLTNQDVPIWLAWLSPRYVYQSSCYGVEAEKTFIAEDGTLFTAHTLDGVDVTYGTTDDEIWRRQFGYDENDTFMASNWTLANHPVVEITSLEYEGTTIYVAQIDLSRYLYPKWDVTWVDYESGVVFSLDGDAENPDALIGYAKEIIDLNK